MIHGWFHDLSVSLGQKKDVQIHSDHMTEPNPYPPPNNSKVLIEAVAMASACKGFTHSASMNAIGRI